MKQPEAAAALAEQEAAVPGTGKTLIGKELPPAPSFFPMEVEAHGKRSEELVPREQAAYVVQLHRAGYKRIVFGKNRRERRAEAARNR